MVIKKSPMAGTLESSDAQVAVEPGEGLEVNISSSVLNQYGRQIEATVLVTPERLDVKNGKVTIIDMGALDCTKKPPIFSQGSSCCCLFPWCLG